MMTAAPEFCSFAGRKTLIVGRLTFVTWRAPCLPVTVSSAAAPVSPGTLAGQSGTTSGSAPIALTVRQNTNNNDSPLRRQHIRILHTCRARQVNRRKQRQQREGLIEGISP